MLNTKDVAILRELAALAATAGLRVIPHAYSAPHLHFVAATVNAPMAEYFPLPVWEKKEQEGEPFFLGEAPPRQGRLTLPAGPGLGISLNEKIYKENRSNEPKQEQKR